MNPPWIVLCGLRCSGKTETGLFLADLLRVRFFDLDDEVETREHAAPAMLIEMRGLEAFRQAEHRALIELFARESTGVLALGGGAPTHPPIEAALRESIRSGRSQLVYLRTQPQVLAARLEAPGNASGRPALTGAEHPASEVAELFAARDPLYQRLATRIIDTAGLDQTEVARLIADETDRFVP